MSWTCFQIYNIIINYAAAETMPKSSIANTWAHPNICYKLNMFKNWYQDRLDNLHPFSVDNFQCRMMSWGPHSRDKMPSCISIISLKYGFCNPVLWPGTHDVLWTKFKGQVAQLHNMDRINYVNCLSLKCNLAPVRRIYIYIRPAFKLLTYMYLLSLSDLLLYGCVKD